MQLRKPRRNVGGEGKKLQIIKQKNMKMQRSKSALKISPRNT